MKSVVLLIRPAREGVLTIAVPIKVKPFGKHGKSTEIAPFSKREIMGLFQ